MVTFHRPVDLAEALQVRAETGAIPLAGGTDLLVRHRNWAGTLPRIDKPVVYVGHLQELRRIDISGNGSGPQMTIGASVTYSELLDHPTTPQLLRDSIIELAAPGLRNVATLAGNICNASPAADAACALYALDAEVELAGPSGRRRLPIAEFITGPGRTALNNDELVTAIHLPPDNSTVKFYKKVGTRRANALSKLSLCACARIVDRTVTEIGIAVGAVAPTIVRDRDIEHHLQNTAPEQLALRIPQTLQQYAELIRPIDDQRSTAEYRKHTALALIEQFLTHELR